MRKRSSHTVFPPVATSLRTALVILSVLTLSVKAFTQTPPREYQVKAVFLYNFTQFVEWPPAALGTGNAPFIIGILGRDPFGSYLDETVAGETLLGHPIRVERYAEIKDIKSCHILFISKEQEAREAVSALDDRSILTVSDTDDFAKKGGMIRFFMQNNKIRLQINLPAAKAVKLDISSKLLRVSDFIE